MNEIIRDALAGETLLLYGRLGIGKTAILACVAEGVRLAGRQCAVAFHTERLEDVTDALLRVYPSIAGTTRFVTRARLRTAIASGPGVVLLDHVRATTSPVRTYLRSLRASGVGVVLAADVEHARDHAQARALRLAYRELEVPPLIRRHLERLLDEQLARHSLRRSLDAEDRRQLLNIAAGRPGVVILLVRLLEQDSSWLTSRILWEVVRCDVSFLTAVVFLHPLINRRTKRHPARSLEARGYIEVIEGEMASGRSAAHSARRPRRNPSVA